MSASPILDPAFAELAGWNIFDANARVGRSGTRGSLALETDGLLLEMDRFGIRRALASHFAAEEYDAERGNHLLGKAIDGVDRLFPLWAAVPDEGFTEGLARRRPRAVRLFYNVRKHNFSPAAWCSGALHDFLQQNSVLAVIAKEDIEWEALARLLQDFSRLNVLLLETGYRSDRYLFPSLQRFPNLYFDSSTYLAHRQLETFVNRFGPERLVFGSRLPLYTPGAALTVLATARIPEAAKRAIAGATLARLLGIEREPK